LLALKEAEVSSGQIRVMNAVTAGTPIVASLTHGIADYIESGRTALTFEPGDTDAARDAVNRLLRDAELRNRIRSAALNAAQGDTLAAYLERIGRLIAEADAAASAASAGSWPSRRSWTAT
jgi:glycosyltransferase involved in cell wall biosynthesis